MPYLTPDETPTEVVCRSFNIPDYFGWDAIIYGALSELAKSYNWEQFGSTSIADCLDQVNRILNEYISNACVNPEVGCELEDGVFTLRLGLGGHVEQWRDGSWETPDGVYEQPPTPVREEDTDEEKRCAAAANAANVYAELYEITTDAATDFEFLDEFLDGVFDGIGTVIGPWAGETATSLAQLGRQFASQFFFVWEEITEDYWDAEFEDYFKCLLYTYSEVNGDGSVSFDYDQIRSHLSTDGIASLDINRMLLAAQLDYLFYYAGGADGFNAAGGTTAITDAECDECEDSWCADFDFTIDAQGWSAVSSQGQYVSGVGFQTTAYNAGAPKYRGMVITNAISGGRTITQFLATYSVTWGGLQGVPTDARNVTLRLNQTATPNDPTRNFYPNEVGSLVYNGSLASVTSLNFLATTAYDATNPYTDLGGQLTLTRIRVRGLGDNPFTGYECE